MVKDLKANLHSLRVDQTKNLTQLDLISCVTHFVIMLCRPLQEYGNERRDKREREKQRERDPKIFW